MGKSNILEGVRTDQLPMVVKTGSSAAVTHTENIKYYELHVLGTLQKYFQDQ
jgi:hypothetical protein